MDIIHLLSALTNTDLFRFVFTWYSGEDVILQRLTKNNLRLIRLNNRELFEYRKIFLTKKHTEWKPNLYFSKINSQPNPINLVSVFYEGSFDGNYLNADRFFVIVQLKKSYGI